MSETAKKPEVRALTPQESIAIIGLAKDMIMSAMQTMPGMVAIDTSHDSDKQIEQLIGKITVAAQWLAKLHMSLS